MDSGICRRRALLSHRTRYSPLGGAVRGLGSGGAVDRDRTDVHSRAGLDAGTTEDQPAERDGIGLGCGGRRDAYGRGTYSEGFKLGGSVRGVVRVILVVVGE